MVEEGGIVGRGPAVRAQWAKRSGEKRRKARKREDMGEMAGVVKYEKGPDRDTKLAGDLGSEKVVQPR